jgi:uncharacterized protein YndB with AHSA1/START domain
MKTTITSEMVYDVCIRDLWEAVTNSANFKKWYFEIPNFSIVPNDSFEFMDRSKTHRHRCTILTCEPEKSLIHTWELPEESNGSSQVEWKLESIDDSHSKLTIIHSGIDAFKDAGESLSAKKLQEGWDRIVHVYLRNYLYLIEKLHFSININAPKHVVWKRLWNKESFKIWSKPLFEGSHYEGEIKLNGRIHFLTPTGYGLFSDIQVLKPEELIIFKHIGKVVQSKEQELDEKTKRWTGCFELYRLMEISKDMTELEVEIDVTNSRFEYMRKHFTTCLDNLKELCEAKQ